MKTDKELELLLIIKGHEKQKLQLKIKYAIGYIEMLIEEVEFEEMTAEDYIKQLNKIINILKGEDDEICN